MSQLVARTATGHRRGEHHHRAKYPDHLVEQARQMRDRRVPMTEISRQLDVPYFTVVDWCQYRSR